MVIFPLLLKVSFALLAIHNSANAFLETLSTETVTTLRFSLEDLPRLS